MVRCIKYPSINQWRNLVKDVNERACYVGKDEEGNPIFDYLKPKPTLTFEITEKIHGCNAGVSYSNQDGIWYQSRENVITVEKDNMGFAFFCEQRKEVLIKMINELAEDYPEATKNLFQKYLVDNKFNLLDYMWEEFKEDDAEPVSTETIYEVLQEF